MFIKWAQLILLLAAVSIIAYMANERTAEYLFDWYDIFYY